jgi:hypothetical protein
MQSWEEEDQEEAAHLTDDEEEGTKRAWASRGKKERKKERFLLSPETEK